jgi:hypothetical protein
MDYKGLLSALEPDECAVYKWMYLESPWLYDQVKGVIYILRRADRQTGNTFLDFVDEKWLASALTRHPETEVIDELLLVRLRGGSPGMLEGDILNKEELGEDPDKYTVLDVYVMVSPKIPPYHIQTVSVSTYQHMRDDYDLVDVGYVVAPHSPKQERIKCLLRERTSV